MVVGQTSANNSTLPRYSKSIRHSAIIQGQIVAQYLIFDSVFDLIFDSRSSNSTTIHQIYESASTQLRSRTFSIRLDDESRVGTPKFVVGQWFPTTATGTTNAP